MPANLANIVPDRETLVQRAKRLSIYACQSKRGAILDCCHDIDLAEAEGHQNIAASKRHQLRTLMEGVGP